MKLEKFETDRGIASRQELAELDQALLDSVAGGLRAQGMDYDE